LSMLGARITLRDDDRVTLERWARSRTVAARLVVRARIVLAAADGQPKKSIARDLGIERKTVALWEGRYAERGIPGIEKDAERGKPPRKLDDDAIAAIVTKTTQETPTNATHWSTRSMAEAAGVSHSSIGRIWRQRGLKPHLSRTFKVSKDPKFAEKLEEIVGLYMNPPENALVFSVDEKSQIQALDRTQPGLPLKKGRCGTMTHDYKRNGTTTLFAALCTLSGHVISECMARHRHQEWLKFLKKIDSEVPKGLDLHIICDNYATHKHEKVQRWLAKNPRIHMHFTPTSASWLNMVERFFRDLTDKQIRRGVFKSVDDLIVAIDDYVTGHNQAPKPFIWTKSARDILAKVMRAKSAITGGPTA
jgi:transposase